MAQHAFQEQLVSIMEILAKAAVAEINRRVDDGCAVIRLELSRNQRDIDTLKRKCQVMENELRKARARGRRKVLFCRTSEKLPMPFPSVWVRDTDLCRAEQTNSPQEADPGQSAQHVQKAVQILEDTPKVPVIKEEGTECETWNSGDAAGQFPFEHRESLPHSLAQETSEEQNQLHEGMERPSTRFTCMLSSTELVKSDEEGLSKLSLHVKEEREQEEEKEGHNVVEGTERSMGETGDHLEFAQRDARLWSTSHEQEHNGEAEWTDQSFTSAQLSHDHGAFSQPVDTATEHCGDDSQMELYNAGQVNAQKQLQASWCRERQSSGAVKGLNTQLCTQQQHGSPSGAGEGVLGASLAQTRSDMDAQALLGYSRGGLSSVRRLRTHWRTNVAGERRFSCSFCERRFVRFGQLKEHLRSHTGERPYTCAQCGRSFTKQGNLIRHAVVHSGEKPYQCSLCGKCFTQRSSLKSHQKTHMPEREDALQGLPVLGNGLVVTQSRGFL